jgi:hypothetical protein
MVLVTQTGHMVRDGAPLFAPFATASLTLGRLGCDALPHHEGLYPHPEERTTVRVSKDEAHELNDTNGPHP